MKKRCANNTNVYITRFNKDIFGQICDGLDTIDVLNLSLLVRNPNTRERILTAGLVHMRLCGAKIYADKLFEFLKKHNMLNRVCSIRAECVRICLPEEFGMVVFLNRLPNLEVLCLNYCGPLMNALDPDELEPYNRIDKLPPAPSGRLKTLSLKHWDAKLQLKNAKQIASYCVNLTTLKIVNTYIYTTLEQDPFYPFVNYYKQLKNVKLNYCEGFRYIRIPGVHRSADNLFEKFSNLHRITVPDNLSVFGALQNNCTNLKHLTLQLSTESDFRENIVDDNDVYSDLFGRLESLQLKNKCILNNHKFWTCAITQCHHLLALILNNVPKRSLWKTISKCVHLTTLKIRRCDALTDEDFLKLANNCKLIEVLKLGKCDNITSAGVSQLAYNTANLTELSFSDCPGVTGAVIYFITARCFNLEKLSLKRCGKENDSVSLLIAETSKIRKLVLNSMEWVTDITMKNVVECCPLLTLIDLIDTNISNNTLSELAKKCIVLKVAKLEWCDRLTTDGIIKFCKSGEMLQLVIAIDYQVKILNIKEHPNALKLTSSESNF